MLTTYLNNQPFTKFILIQDTLDEPGDTMLKYIIESHLKGSSKIHQFVFEGNFETTSRALPHVNIEYHDFVSDVRGWLNTNTIDFPSTISKLQKDRCIIVLNSLSHAILQYGIVTIYKVLQQLINHTGLCRVVAILHRDVCEDVIQTVKYFEHLSTLAVILESRFQSNNSRVSYVFKKPGGKCIKKIEEYKFENGILKTEDVKKLDVKSLIEGNLHQTNPENIATFKIALNEEEKESRDKLILPYLPKLVADGEEQDSQIFYKFDEMDDWDEEDPDDDLDL